APVARRPSMLDRTLERRRRRAVVAGVQAAPREHAPSARDPRFVTLLLAEPDRLLSGPRRLLGPALRLAGEQADELQDETRIRRRGGLARQLGGRRGVLQQAHRLGEPSQLQQRLAEI